MQIILHLFKRLFLIPLVLIIIAGTPVRGGEPVIEKNVAPPPPQLFGTGWYAAIDMGANVFQSRGGSRTFSDEFGDTLTIDPKNDVGFFGGIKGGYVFGTGVVRPTLEGDFFYNGFRGGADTTLNIDGVVTRGSTSTSFINTGAFMGNALLRFAFGRFQPYAGAGVGVCYAESAGLDVNTPHGTFSTGGGHNHADLAWQVIAGTDYYWTPKWSTFIEYHYLNYTSTQVDTNHSRDLGQHLIGAGVRFHL